MRRVSLIEHQGRQILYIDFSGLRRSDDALVVITEAREVIAGQEPNSLLTLTNIEGADFDLTVIRALWRLARQNKPYVRAAAVVGASGILQQLLQLISRMARRKFLRFATEEEAKDWLVTQ